VRLLFDTSVYLDVLRDDAFAGQFRPRFGDWSPARLLGGGQAVGEIEGAVYVERAHALGTSRTPRSRATAVVYDSPSRGRITFGQTGSFVVAGSEIPLGDSPRYDNPFARAPFGATEITISHDGYAVQLDFAAPSRTVSGR
jgi:hypothetical protein